LRSTYVSSPTIKNITLEPFSLLMEEKFAKLLERFYEEDFYDYREDLLIDVIDLDEKAQEVAFEARANTLVPLIDSLGHQLDKAYPDLSVEEIALAIKYLIDGELGSSIIIYGDEVLEKCEYPKDVEEVGEKIDGWIADYIARKKANFEIVEVLFVFDQLIRGYRGSDEDDQFILIPELEEEDEEE